VDRYFRQFGTLTGWQLRVYQRGLAGAEFPDAVRLGDSVSVLDEAIAQGRGVVLTAPHVFGHELAFGLVAQRHKSVGFVRRSGNPAKQRIKERWYRQLGIETITRSHGASLNSDLRACVRTLRSGRIVAISPDLVISARAGMPVNVFGRQVHVPSAIIGLPILCGATVVNFRLSGFDSEAQATVEFHATHLSPPRQERRANSSDRKRQVRDGLQEWFREFEAYLCRCPEAWMFWLDKRWTEVIRQRSRS
jgi:lauroyl/myristoyl acyltransferase